MEHCYRIEDMTIFYKNTRLYRHVYKVWNVQDEDVSRGYN
jgi:hypothetical protein